MSLHLVDDDGHLQPETKIVEFIGSLVPKVRGRSATANYEELLREVGVNYHIVGVFGGQSSGKSTLLNNLFGTNFQTLDETVRRGQTTKGAFFSKANTALEGFVEGPAATMKAPLLVVDFEGTDGLERGEDQSFERQLSLFGLSMADTLIINMWAVDVGRFNAANLSLLRTIFEVNLQLFSHDSYERDEKPTLLIVLRDFTDADPTPSLTTVRKSFDMIWDNITRPAAFANEKIDALFNLKYYVMPHYKLQRKEFDSSVTTLRHWFGDSSCKDYLFRHKAMFRGVPLEGLPQYMLSCWEAIITSKDLDIPTQREMLAQHRCKEAVNQELETFHAFTRQYEDRINRGEMLVRLSEILDEEMDARMAGFAAQTKLYNPDVAARYAKQLEAHLVDATMKVVGRLSGAIAAEVLAGLDARLQGTIDDCIAMALKSAQSIPFGFTGGGDGNNNTTTGPGFGGGGGGGPGQQQGGAAGFGSLIRFYMDTPQCQQVVIRFWKKLRTDLNGLLGEMSVDPPPSHLYGRFTSLVAQDATARGNVVNAVTQSLFRKVIGRVSSMSESAAESIHRGFEQSLSHNPDGSVKFFATTKGLQQAVPGAQQSALVLLGCLLYFRLQLAAVHLDAADEEDSPAPSKITASRSARRILREQKRVSVRQSSHEKDFLLTYTAVDSTPTYPVQVPVAPVPMDGEDAQPGVEAACVLLTQPQVQRTCEVFRQKCDFTTQIQLRTIESNSQRLPAWVIPALCILGFNEIKYILTHPFLLVLCIVIGYVFFKNYIIGQWEAFQETGPATVVIPLQTLVHQLTTIYEQNIEPQLQQFQQPVQQQQYQGAQAPYSQQSYGGHAAYEEPQLHQSARPKRSAQTSNSSSALPTPKEDAAGGMRQRTSTKTQQPKTAVARQASQPQQQHLDPVQQAVAEAKSAGLPRRRSAQKEM